MTVRRTLPQRARTLIGAWCFAGHYGPDDVALIGGMRVAPHPHTGLQTVSLLFSDEIEHRDSLGNRAFVPGRRQGTCVPGVSSLAGDTSPVATFTPLLDAELSIEPAATLHLAIDDVRGRRLWYYSVGRHSRRKSSCRDRFGRVEGYGGDRLPAGAPHATIAPRRNSGCRARNDWDVRAAAARTSSVPAVGPEHTV